ncbi:MAG: lipid-binding SYLF domain-containing protein [Acidobacteriota bacterium]|nr:lipid-binding SYLF domain-containing protein [Acidobacteriota bacterium]
MRRLQMGCAVLAAALMVWTAVPRAAGDSEEAARVREASTVFNEIMEAPDHAVPDSVLHKAAAIAVFPSVLKVGFIFGAKRGRGIISVRDANGKGWSSPAFLTITGGSFGAQIGGASTDLVLIIMNRRGVEHLLSNQFKIGGEATAAAGPVGRDAEASTDIQMRAEILSYSRSRGLFAGITINGASIRQDLDANQAFYGKRYTSRQIALQHMGGAPEPTAAWEATLAKYVK